MLRINNDGTIPTDNPFYTSTTGNNRAIWALGLRNPFTFAFNAASGLMFINDVGETSWEEIDDGVAGANYGWPTTEGSTTDVRFTSPRYAYDHTGACAITGGDFYVPLNPQFPSEYLNDYFFADYCGWWIKKLDPATNSVVTFATGIPEPVGVKVSSDGMLYYLARGTGSNTGIVYRIEGGSGASGPSITTQPVSATAYPGDDVIFSVRASGSTPLAYRWQRNGADIAGAMSPDYTVPAVSWTDNGAQFHAIVDRATGQPVGVASYLRIDPAAGSIEVGHINFSPALQRTVAATEAMYLMMKRAFGLGYRRYEWKCDSLNAPSRAAAARLGFQYEGRFRQAVVNKGRNRDTDWFSILDSEWPALKRAYGQWLSEGNFDAGGRQKRGLAELIKLAR
jgi:hypothetical protein